MNQPARDAPFFVVLNPGSGRGDPDETRALIERVFTEAGREHQVLMCKDRPVDQVAAQAVDLACARQGIVVAAGGDGTINAVVNAVLGRGCAFGVLPQGTFNYFGRTHGISAETEIATRALLESSVEPVQVGQVNGRAFLVNASLGLYPQLLEDREAYKQRYGRSRLVALWSAVVTVASNIKTAVMTPINAVKSALTNVWNSIKSTTTAVWNGIKNAIVNPIQTAKTLITNAINALKNLFSGLNFQLPHFKLPHFNISGGKFPWGIGGEGSKPEISVSWYAKGGIFDAPSVIGVGESGAEAVVPLSGNRMMPFAKAIASEMAAHGGSTNTFYITVDGAQNPEEFADRLVRQIQMRTRMA